MSLYPFPGQVVSSAEVERENTILALNGIGPGEAVLRDATIVDAELEVPEIPQTTLGGFSIAMAGADALVDYRLNDAPKLI